MSVEPAKQTYGFQTEVKQLLNLMIHSLYSKKEIFLRELISNASDAEDKLRFAALSDSSLKLPAEMAIYIDIDKAARTLTVHDTGIGMSREEAIEHLGTIAKSGTKEFLAALSQDQAKNSNMIGQFGVGFYSAFMVADKVTVKTRKANLPADQAICWESTGDGQYTVETITKERPGTEVILHLKADEDSFLDAWHLRSLVHQYSDHIAFPVMMKKASDDDAAPSEEYETVNSATALWAKPKNDITDSEYNEFYKHISHDFQDPLTWTHYKVEGNLEYTALFYIPAHPGFDLWERERKSGIKLYIQRVFIMDNAEVLPAYLRFVKGVLDSNDLPLNVSREILQNNATLEKIRSASTKKILNLLEKIAGDDKDQYTKVWTNFGQVLKEGVVEDANNKGEIAKLLRFASTHKDTAEQSESIEAYVSRMQADQKSIYYIIADSFAAAKNSPHLEIFRKKGIEVLLLSDKVDEWVMSHLQEFEGKLFVSANKADLSLSDAEKEADAETEVAEKELQPILEQMKKALGDKVKEIKFSHRLTDSPACIVSDSFGMSLHLQRMMAAAGQSVPASAPILEINPNHSLVKRLSTEQDEAKFTDWSILLFEQALLAEGTQLEDPAAFVKRMNRYLI
ncbi:MAG: molecular chaperone HtpG [Gammaproteobacteria bacterium]|nr:molecular chaperone HtpG [Gammaproteobacteria bacterium]